MITEITKINFRHFEDVVFRPNENVSLLCGLNGIGKSSIVYALNRLKGLLVYGEHIWSLFNELDILKRKYENFLEECSCAVRLGIKIVFILRITF